jgi:hypothetical protein
VLLAPPKLKLDVAGVEAAAPNSPPVAGAAAPKPPNAGVLLGGAAAPKAPVPPKGEGAALPKAGAVGFLGGGIRQQGSNSHLSRVPGVLHCNVQNSGVGCTIS